MLRFRLPIPPGTHPVAKLFVFLLVLFGIYLLRRALVRPSKPSPRESAQPTAAAPERMIECAHCGLHVPESEAVAEAGLSFCCEAHRRAHRQAPGAGG